MISPRLIEKTAFKILNTRLGRKYLGIDQDQYLKPTDKIISFSANSYVIEKKNKTADGVFRGYPRVAAKVATAMGVGKQVLTALTLSQIARMEPHFGIPFMMLTLGTYRPDGNPGTTSCDGRSWRNTGTNETWAALLAGGATNALSDDTGVRVWRYVGTSTSQRYVELQRSWWGFDTSAIGNHGSVNSGSVQLNGNHAGNRSSALANESACLVAGSPASNTTIGTADHTQMGGALLSDTLIDVPNWSTTGYNTFTLNAAGIAYVKRMGVTMFGGKGNSYDRAGSQPTWSSNSAFVTACCRENGTAGTDPLLVVNYDIVDSVIAGNIPFFGGGISSF